MRNNEFRIDNLSLARNIMFLTNRGAKIALYDKNNNKVNEVFYLAEETTLEGWTLLFGRNTNIT